MKVLLISESNKLLEIAAKYESFKQKNINFITMRSSLLNASQRIASELPDVVILDVSDGRHHEFDLAERFKAQYKNMAFMMMSDDSSSELLLKAIRSGFSEVITLPLYEEKLLLALQRFQIKQASSASHHSKVISVISCKGGSGATFIATNLGYILATLFNKRVLLIDINQYFGDASMYVTDKKPGMTLSDVCNQISRLDLDFLESSLITVAPNYKILAAAESPDSAADIKPEHLDTIIRIARNNYDYILLDVGRQIDALTMKGLDLSDTIYTVTQLVLPYIRDAKNLLTVFKSLGYSQKKVQVIVNRYDKASKIKLTDLNGVIAVDQLITIPNDFMAVTDSVNQGVSVYQSHKTNAVSKALIEIVQLITKTQLKEKGFMGKLFGNG